MRVWNLEQCKQIEVWETAHENDVIDAEGRTYCDLAGVYRDQSMLEWYDMAAAGRLSGKGQGVRKHQKAPHARLGRCLCTRDARRQIKETSGRTRWQPFTLVLATDVAVLKAERDCWRLGVFFDAATNIIRLTDGTAHKTLKLTIHALTEKRWVGDAEGAEERTVDGRTLWTYPLPAGVVLPEGLEIPTLPAIPDKPLPLPGEEAAQPDPADEATVEPRPSYGVPDRNATWLYWRKTEKLRPAEIRDRWNELHPKAAIAAGKNGSKLVKVSIGRAEDLEKQGISCQLVPPLKP
jgi:hypothetical protein